MISLDNGFQEAVAIVADDGKSAARLCAALGYVRLYHGSMPPAALSLLGLDSGRRATDTLIGHPDSARGHIRLVAVEGRAAPVMRGGGRAWDSGGIFDINLRALGRSVDGVHEGLNRAGFVAHAPATTWDFGPLAVREVIASDADGLCVAIMKRLHPPLLGYDGIGGPVSWVFNSTQIVPDFDAARALYVEALGWLAVQETRGPAAQASGENCMGLPRGLAPGIGMQIGIYHPHGRMEGSVEIIGFDCGGRDFSAATPPGRGWAALRFAVSDVDSYSRDMAEAGCAVSSAVAFDWAPYGVARAVAAVTPWGARLEAFAFS